MKIFGKSIFGDKESSCPQCSSKGASRDVFQAKGKEGSKLIAQCRSCDCLVYLSAGRKPEEIPDKKRRQIELIDLAHDKNLDPYSPESMRLYLMKKLEEVDPSLAESNQYQSK